MINKYIQEEETTLKTANVLKRKQKKMAFI